MSFKEQYEFEKESALKLLQASRIKREALYTKIYTIFTKALKSESNFEIDFYISSLQTHGADSVNCL